MPPTAPLRIVYLFDDGDESDMALGAIDGQGVISVTQAAPGQAEAVQRMVVELNRSPQVFLRDARTSPKTGRVTQTKQAVRRGAPGFLEALRQTARRFYKADLRFDPALLTGGAPLAPDPTPDDTPPPADDTPPEPDSTPLPDAKPGLEL